MKLHYRTIGEGKPLFILHGLFGSSDNWQTLGKKFGEYFKVYFVDQRNHGHSPHSDEFDYDLMVEDFHELVEDLGENNINILGHSMGGKTAIGFAAKYPELIDKMIVADISHKGYPMHHDIIIEGLESLDLDTIKSRTEADQELAKKIDNWGVRQFLLKNLYWKEKGQLAWRINLPVLVEQMPNIISEIPFETIDTDTLFIRGAKSNYILESDYDEIHHKFPFSKIHTLDDAGHWVHAESPDEFYDAVMRFLL
ncbi:alpha/beta fold hydrolase [Paracrocinitomix mangrovi]|uniref:alpha/beta fold hydrolase n=1 Tax=Paracrocinitomix mangrovi TaxID=2862509 RepID=UPI001C8DE21D|nr:alpha/beta fold hydrolase [Paracrocinitomix mangrovi]UKN01109.1 alpha/beta fold hydrolase [Paracrocinitomix mangrovi]